MALVYIPAREGFAFGLQEYIRTEKPAGSRKTEKTPDSALQEKEGRALKRCTAGEYARMSARKGPEAADGRSLEGQNGIQCRGRNEKAFRP